MVFSSGNGRSPAGEKILRAWLVVCVVVGGLFAVSQLAEIPVRSALRGYDNTFNYLWLRSAMVDGDWDFKNDLALCDTLPPDYRTSALTLPLTPAGRIPNKYGVGWSVLTLPFYLVADAIVALGRWLGVWTLARDGYNPVYQICLQLGHLGLAALALLLAVRTIAAWLGQRESATAGVILVWAASPLLYYQTVNVSMSHGAAFFAVALLAYAASRATAAATPPPGPDRLAASGWWLLAGAGWGLAVTTRFPLGIFGLLAAWSWFGLARGRQSLLRPLGCFAAGAAPFVLLQLWAWRAVYGAWLVFSYGAEGEAFHWSSPELLRSLFSPWHGLLYWHPFLLVGCVGLVGWAGRKSGQAVLLLVLVALNLYLSAAWWCWWFASAFGHRAFDAALLPLMAGCAWLLQRAAGRWRTLVIGLAVAGGLWNFYALLLYRGGAISRSGPVTWWQMIEAVGNLPAALSF